MSDKPLCCQHSEILVGKSGKVSFGFGCVIHPKAKIIVEGDYSIIFGEYNIIEENVTIKATLDTVHYLTMKRLSLCISEITITLK